MTKTIIMFELTGKELDQGTVHTFDESFSEESIDLYDASTFADLDDNEDWFSDEDTFDSISLCLERQQAGKKRVRFQETVQVREHSVTVGDSDGSITWPITLDWASSQPVNRPLKYTTSVSLDGPRRLSSEERRERIQRVQGLDSGDMVLLDFDQTIKRVQELMTEMSMNNECKTIHARMLTPGAA